MLDPACGSGHFLLAAARRLAERLAALRAPEGAVRAQDYRHALREVITHCIYGVDRNPMALELARFALWLEGFEEGRPLGFLDHHLICGDALIGITDLDQLAHGIPDAAFKPLSGDDRAVCKALAKENREGRKAFAKRKADPNLSLALERDNLLAERAELEAMPDETLAQQTAKQAAWERYAAQERASRLQQAADLFVGAFLSLKMANGEWSMANGRKAGAFDADHSPLASHHSPLPHSPITTHHSLVPTSQNLYLALFTDQAPEALSQVRQADRLAHATRLAREARVLHWPLVFVRVFEKGGFDCVLGNPPWERIKLQEEEFFAAENRLVAQARNKAERAQRIEWLAQGMLARHLYPELEHPPDEVAKEQDTYARFIAARRTAEAASVFAHLKAEEGGRYPLTGVGDVNTYALFAETIDQIIGQRGRAGFIVPTGIATDDSTKAYFSSLTQRGRLAALFSFENEEFIFPAVHHAYRFSLVVLSAASREQRARLVFFARQPHQIHDERRQFELTPDDYRLINPNTLTCPVFRSRKDAELTKQIYARVPVLIREARGGEPEINPWGISFMRMFDMSNDSHLFVNSEWRVANGEWQERTDGANDRSPIAIHHSPPATDDSPPTTRHLPLYEAKMIHQYDHRWATYEVNGDARMGDDDKSRAVTLAEKADPAYTVRPRYWVEAREVYLRTVALADKAAAHDLSEEQLEAVSPKWFIGFRDIARATDERTVIASVLPRAGVGNNLPLLLLDAALGRQAAALLANLCALALDFVARHKVGGVHLNFFIAKQLPVLSPESYNEADLAFIVPRVLELTYTARDLKPWAADLVREWRMENGEWQDSTPFAIRQSPLTPYPFDPDRRAQLRAELDAYYARLYGLSREDLCYILDPASVMGEGYPSETFRVLKQSEERAFGEYRTQRLVLEAWDALERGELA